MVNNALSNAPATPSSTTPSAVAGPLVLAPRPRKETPLERFGFDTVTVVVGPGDGQKYNISMHKRLLVNGLEEARLHFEQCPEANVYYVEDATTDVITCVYNYLYSGELPSVFDPNETAPKIKDKQYRLIIDLYIFAEQKKMAVDFLNRIMDALQDFCHHFGVLPEPATIKKIYRASIPTSKLRLFVAQTLLYMVQSGTIKNHASIVEILTSNVEFHKDFLEAVQFTLSGPMDSRVRNCGKDPRCSACSAGDIHETDGQMGSAACLFHYHKDFALTKRLEDGSIRAYYIADECYFNSARR